MIAINLVDGDELRWVKQTTGEQDILISTANGQAIRFTEEDVRPMGRTARGVRGIRLRPNDHVIAMDAVSQGANIIVISENGYGKRTKVEQFSRHRRGGVGTRVAVVNKKTGELVAMRTLYTREKGESDELLLLSAQGQAIRLGINDIPSLSRATQGVRIMRLNSGDIVASVALMKEKELDEVEGAEGADEATKDSDKARQTLTEDK